MTQKTGVGRLKSEVRSQTIRLGTAIALVCLLFSMFCPLAAIGSEKWSGVDESVVEKYAKEHGREARTPFINTDQGDLLLFVFLLAGAIGGFAAGYYWRVLTEGKTQKVEKEQTERQMPQ